MPHLFTSNDDFGKRLNVLMEETGHTQKSLAEKLNISRTAISNYLGGSRMATADILVKIGEVFDVSVDWLLALTNVRAKDAIMKQACAETGLTERSYMALQQIKQEENSTFAAMSPIRKKDGGEPWVIETMNAEQEGRVTKRTRGINALVSSNILPAFSERLTAYLFYYSGEEDKKRQLETLVDTLTNLYDQISNPSGAWHDKAIAKYTKSDFVTYARKVCDKLQKGGDMYLMDFFLESCNDFLRPYISDAERNDIIFELSNDAQMMEVFSHEADKKD